MTGDLKNTVMAAAGDGLRALGMRPLEEGIWLLPLRKGVDGWLGMNVANEAGSIAVNPVIGVRHDDVERMLSRLAGQPEDPGVPTVTVPLGYLTPERTYARWLFNGSAQDDGETARLLEAVRDYGIPFMQANTDRRVLAETLTTSRFMPPDAQAYRIPIIHLLAGDRDRALSALHTSVPGLGSRADEAANQFRRFAAAFEAEAARELPIVRLLREKRKAGASWVDVARMAMNYEPVPAMAGALLSEAFDFSNEQLAFLGGWLPEGGGEITDEDLNRRLDSAAARKGGTA